MGLRTGGLIERARGVVERTSLPTSLQPGDHPSEPPTPPTHTVYKNHEGDIIHTESTATEEGSKGQGSEMKRGIKLESAILPHPLPECQQSSL